MVASQQEKKEVGAVIQEWKSAFGAKDMERVKALWDQDYPQLIYIPEESNEALSGWYAISKYYDAIPDLVESMEWVRESLMVDVLGDVAHAYFANLNTAKVNGIDNVMSFDVRDTFILKKKGGQWKIIHYHESLSRDHSHETWGFLWS